MLQPSRLHLRPDDDEAVCRRPPPSVQHLHAKQGELSPLTSEYDW